MISPGEKSFIIDGFLQNLRSDGRGCEDFRPIALDVGVILTANGSAMCRIGGTVVIAAVKVAFHYAQLFPVKFYVYCKADTKQSG